MAAVSDTEVETLQWELLVDAKAEIGEKPYYHEAGDTLYWLDIYRKSLNSVALSTRATTSWALPSLPGSFAICDDDVSAVVALEDGVHILDLATGELQLGAASPFDTKALRFNDGRCDPAGVFCVGTIRQPGELVPVGSGHFYSFDGGPLRELTDNVTNANGIAFSPDGSVMYLADRVNNRLLAYDYDVATTTATNARTFAALSGEIADGASVDEEGGYWTAIFDTDEVRRYLPDGTLDRVIASPVPHPTMVSFGGTNRDQLILTTGTYRLSDDVLAAHPTTGGVFMTKVDVRGLPEVPYRGGGRS